MKVSSLLSLLAIYALQLLPAVAQSNVTVLAEDPQIVYTGGWINQENGEYFYANGPGSSLSFSFTGTAVYYHSVINPNGGVASIVLDNDSPSLVDESENAYKGEAPIPAVLWSKTDLDGEKNHSLSVSYVGGGVLGGSYVEFYYLQYTSSGSETNEAGSAGPISVSSSGAQGSPSASGTSNGGTSTTSNIKGGTSTTSVINSGTSTTLVINSGTSTTPVISSFSSEINGIGTASLTSVSLNEAHSLPSASGTSNGGASTASLISSASAASSSHFSNTRAIIIGTVAGVGGTLIVASAIILFLCRKGCRWTTGAARHPRSAKINHTPSPYNMSAIDPLQPLRRKTPAMSSLPLAVDQPSASNLSRPDTPSEPLIPANEDGLTPETPSHSSHNARVIKMMHILGSSRSTSPPNERHLTPGLSALLSHNQPRQVSLVGSDSLTYLSDPPPVYDGRRMA
ncbi:uncharacterized protein FIBRA_06557 [Fibroporia radiculosa]|uniref:Mid2 domain-containing protein n=1 Tax=Fibroporia radiculosa TaxID=599839 RepID=J4HZB6_9APHY|nr:uncharacterized protein FIBRA_06557 [Fibroporia radiculosa]CCM04382.1 predicted protein [Fibroporia radiculosa]